MTVFKGYAFGVLFAIFCLSLAFVLYKLGADKRYTRKTVHILIGFEWVILNRFFGTSYHLLVVCVAFLCLLFIVHKKSLMPMIGSDGDNSPGTVYYCISMSIMSAITLVEPRFMIPFGIAVFATSLGDGFAGVIGFACKKYNPKIWKNKTLAGSLSGIIFSFGASLAFMYSYGVDRAALISVLIALLAAVLELFTTHGLDNITLPLGVSTFAFFLIYHTDAALWYAVPVILSPALLAVVIDKRLLTPRGTLAALVLDIAVSVAFGNAGFIMMVVFLVGGVLIDKVKGRVKKNAVEAKSDRSRDTVQVIANSLPAFVSSLAFFITKNPVFVFAYSASVAEAFADTCGSGFGVFSRRTVDVFRLKRAEQGMSGGVSVVGTLASALGALAVALIPLAFGLYGFTLALLAALVAFLGTVIDSLLGSLLQVKYRCVKCGKLTEKTEHCSRGTAHVSGISFIDNDAVNLTSGVLTAVIAIILYICAF